MGATVDTMVELLDEKVSGQRQSKSSMIKNHKEARDANIIAKRS